MYIRSMSGIFDDEGEQGPLFFNSTKVPGICKPMDRMTLEVVIDMQKQLNRSAHGAGIANRISTDGDVGPATGKLLGQVISKLSGLPPMNTSSCAGFSPHSREIANAAATFADKAGVPKTVSSLPPTKVPSFVDPKTGLDVKVPTAGAGILGAFTSMSTPMKLAFAGILGGIGYFLFVGKKG